MVINFTYYRASNSPIANLRAKLSFKKKLIEVTQRHGVQGFTLVTTLGAWQGKTEPSYQLTVVNIDRKVVIDMATEMRDVWQQDSVMVTDDKGKVYFV